MPGEFRTSQNWIGGNSINTADFIPPRHDFVNELMGDLENFLHSQLLCLAVCSTPLRKNNNQSNNLLFILTCINF
jgi:hypothetical protein